MSIMYWGDKGADPVVTLDWFVCLSVTMVTGDLTAYGTESYTGGL